ncbi:hypothetical protein Dacet_1252 [Denitrovibrio acetiphilus DSM 12809]|uniref:Lipoprotein n=1 Tax=Denitrovibrio acetiphilus (strain DSM 12809 / NBRC 114555 / N2460) TaxID=522772 RepID=D4H7M5_DENA2|nr:hypothetical protein [Denitrovibrio acetiphilus]ADD68024.1 hypothetical protein Dacet_1252 [Denitrovibrio acetiphilus DSM 12809]
MRKFYLLPVLLLLLVGCYGPKMGFNSTDDLKTTYDQSAKDDHIAIFYSVKDMPDKKIINMSVKNVGKIFMKSLTVNYEDGGQITSDSKVSYNYKNLGSLKNRAHKKMTLNIAKETAGVIKIHYKYLPVQEDSFLITRDEATPLVEPDEVTGEIILFIK